MNVNEVCDAIMCDMTALMCDDSFTCDMTVTAVMCDNVSGLCDAVACDMTAVTVT